MSKKDRAASKLSLVLPEDRLGVRTIPSYSTEMIAVKIEQSK